MKMISLINVLAGMLLAPLFLGVITRIKAFFAGRQGQPLLQLYYDLYKLARKGAVYSRTTSWLFRAGAVVPMAAVSVALFLVPAGAEGSAFFFGGDLILAVYLLGLARFFTVLAAMDTGSSFEGMGASREVRFAVLAEPALFLGLAALVRTTGKLSLSGIYASLGPAMWGVSAPVLVLVSVAFLIVTLAESSRVPVDDPNTHLELTMIHEVMALDHSGPDLALILYAAALKLWLLASLFAGVFCGAFGSPSADWAVFIGAMAFTAVLIGVIESVMARMRMVKVPQLLLIALALSTLALIFSMR